MLKISNGLLKTSDILLQSTSKDEFITSPVFILESPIYVIIGTEKAINCKFRFREATSFVFIQPAVFDGIF